MARTDIARVVARAVLDDILDKAVIPEGLDADSAVSGLLTSAVTVKRRQTKKFGEVVELVFVVPPDPTTPEDD